MFAFSIITDAFSFVKANRSIKYIIRKGTGIKMEEESLKILKENQELLRKQVKLGGIRNGILLLVAVVFIIGMCFVMTRLNQAMDTVNSINELTNEMSEEIENIDVDKLNTTLDNLSTISENLKEASDSFSNFSDSMSSMFNFK